MIEVIAAWYLIIDGRYSSSAIPMTSKAACEHAVTAVKDFNGYAEDSFCISTGAPEPKLADPARVISPAR